MQSPIKPLSPFGVRTAVVTKWLGVLLFILSGVLLIRQHKTLHLEGQGPHGKVYVQVDLDADFNGIGQILKGDGLYQKRVKMIAVTRQGRLGTWLTRDEDLEKIGDWDRRVAKNGYFTVYDDRLFLMMDDKRANSESALMDIGLPDRRRKVTKMDYSSAAFDQEFELVWKEQ